MVTETTTVSLSWTRSEMFSILQRAFPMESSQAPTGLDAGSPFMLLVMEAGHCVSGWSVKSHVQTTDTGQSNRSEPKVSYRFAAYAPSEMISPCRVDPAPPVLDTRVPGVDHEWALSGS